MVYHGAFMVEYVIQRLPWQIYGRVCDTVYHGACMGDYMIQGLPWGRYDRVCDTGLASHIYCSM